MASNTLHIGDILVYAIECYGRFGDFEGDLPEDEDLQFADEDRDGIEAKLKTYSKDVLVGLIRHLWLMLREGDTHCDFFSTSCHILGGETPVHLLMRNGLECKIQLDEQGDEHNMDDDDGEDDMDDDDDEE